MMMTDLFLLKVLCPELEALVHVGNVGPGDGGVWPVVGPRAYHCFTVWEMLSQSEGSVSVAVMPATEYEDGDLDLAVVLSHGAVSPVLIVLRVLQPCPGQDRMIFHIFFR